MNPWLTVLQNVGVFSIASFFIQRYMNSSADRKLADYKKDIDKELANYKSKLDEQMLGYKSIYDQDLENHKSQLKFLNDQLGSLHTKRLDVIKEINTLLVELQGATVPLVSIRLPLKDQEEDRRHAISLVTNAHDAFRKFNNCILLNKIYFDNKLATKLDTIRQDYQNAQWSLRSSEFLTSIGIPGEIAYKDHFQKVTDATKKINEDIPKAITELENEFRYLLGAEEKRE